MRESAAANAPDTAPQRLCASADLVERGKAVVFDVLLWGQPARAFALRFNGQLVAYINRCAHVPVEMDWQPGEFLDHDKRWIVCSIHGATYEPCGRSKLMRLTVAEHGDWACWYPSVDIQPVLPVPPSAPESTP